MVMPMAGSGAGECCIDEKAKTTRSRDPCLRPLASACTDLSALQPKVPDTVKRGRIAESRLDAPNKRVALGGLREPDSDPTEYMPPTVARRLMRLMGDLDGGYTAPPTEVQNEDLAALTTLSPVRKPLGNKP